MQRFPDTTTIEIGDDYAVQIKETPNDLIMRKGSLPQV